MTFRARFPLRTDWRQVRDAIDLMEVATRLLGPPLKREGLRFLWLCPFHDDHNPSLVVEPDRGRWGCYPCGLRGDAITLFMRLERMSFPQAMAYLTGGLTPSVRPRPRPEPRPKAPASTARTGMTPEFAASFVAESAARIWTAEGADALADLTGPRRCLTPETIRAAGVGWTSKAVGVAWSPPGIVIPWLVGGRLARVKVRPDDAWRRGFPETRRPPKYVQAYCDPALVPIYPGPEKIRRDRPLVVPEGELDALCLGEVLGELASVVTLGGASARPTPAALVPMLQAARWYVATDRDEAGDKAAADWPASARRVRPPGSFKDWTEARAAGVDLARWWGDVLAGDPRPPLFLWDELAGRRWGPAVDDPAAGLDNPGRRPGLDTLARALDPAADPAFLAERAAIRAENDGGPGAAS